MEQVFSYIISLGASVMMPIIFTVIGLCIGMKFGKAGGGIFSFLREHDVFVPKGISDVGAREELVQHGLQRFVVHRKAHFAVGVDVRRIVDERTARLLLDSLENRDDRRVRGIEAHTREGLLRLCCGRGGAEASQEQHRDNEQTTETCSDNTSSPACRKVSFFHGSDFRLV